MSELKAARGEVQPYDVAFVGHAILDDDEEQMERHGLALRDHDLGAAHGKIAYRAINRSKARGPREALCEAARNRIAMLTPRQHEVMRMVLAGHHNKNIAADLGVSQRTVENHRASIMRHTGAKSLPELARIAMAAVRDDGA